MPVSTIPDLKACLRGLLAVAGGVLVALLGGCAQVYDVKVDAMQNKEVQPGHSYRLVAKNGARAESDPNVERARAMVGKALSGHGMYEAEKPEDAEVVVEVDYDVGARRVVVQTVPSLEERVPLVGPRGEIMPNRPILIGDGSTPEVVARSVYEKTLTIVAREGPAARQDGSERPPRELWRVEVRVDDEKDSVDKVLPVMVGAAVDHIGTDSATQQVKRVSEDAEPVNFVKAGS